MVKKRKQITAAKSSPSPLPIIGQQGRFFGEPQYTPGEVNFKSAKSDDWVYKQYPKYTPPLQEVPCLGRVDPPEMHLEDIVQQGIIQRIQKAGRIVFHAVGDTGAKFTVAGLQHEAAVTDKMAEDFNEQNPADIPSFLFHLGDVVYYFGEDVNYYDQFYEPFRNYQAPIFAIPGNHDSNTYPNDPEVSLEGFLKHFCSETPIHAPEAGGLSRTTMTQPEVYFSLSAPFVTIIGLYSNALEIQGIISSDDPYLSTHPEKAKIDNRQKEFLTKELKKLHDSKYSGAIIIAVHHPPFTSGEVHGPSPGMLQDIDDAVQSAGIAPHAVLSGHSHNYQRYTRLVGKTEVPYIVAGSGGYNVLPIKTGSGKNIIRPGMTQDNVRFDRYYADYGYLRIVVTQNLLSIEFHDVSSGLASKSPADVCTVDLQTRKLTTACISS